MTNAILRLPAVKASTGLSRSMIYQLIAAGDFPRQINLGARAVGWLESDVQAWIRVKASGAGPAQPGPVQRPPSTPDLQRDARWVQSRSRRLLDPRPRTAR
jgi:prophage regulatory protein